MYPLLGKVDSGRGSVYVRVGGICELSVLSCQFCCESLFYKINYFLTVSLRKWVKFHVPIKIKILNSVILPLK